MSDTTQTIQKRSKNQEPPKSGRGKKTLLIAVTLLLVLAIVFIAAWRDGTGFDALHRYFNYGTASESGKISYHYDAENSSRFAMIGDKLVVLSNTSLRLLASDGSEIWSSNVKMANPALAKGGSRVAAYDVGGTELYVLDENGRLPILDQNGQEAERTDTIISASLNQKGALALTTQAKNYKGCVNVYNEELKQIFEFHSSRRFVTDAYVTDDGKNLAAVTLGQEDSVFVSNVVLYDLNETEPFGSYDIADGLVVSLGYQGGRLAAVTDTGVTFASYDGKIAGTYQYREPYLREYDLGGDDFAALLLNRYKSGSVGRLVTVASDGTEIAALDVNQEVLSLSACGRYLAVLYADSMVIYNRDLQVYSTLHGTGSVRSVLARNDGSVLMLKSDTAELFLP